MNLVDFFPSFDAALTKGEGGVVFAGVKERQASGSESDSTSRGLISVRSTFSSRSPPPSRSARLLVRGVIARDHVEVEDVLFDERNEPHAEGVAAEFAVLAIVGQDEDRAQ
jgi:hypothetical protein